MSRLRRPGLVVLLVAPFLGECASGATPPLDLLLPWNLVLLAALYGSGALLCREAIRRRGLGLRELLLLGAAYGVFEEAIVDRFWFSPSAWHDLGIGRYSVVWHTNVLAAVHLTLFHAVVSVTATVVLVERAFPTWRERAWAGPKTLGLAAVALFVAVPLAYGELGKGPAGPQLAALGLCALLVTVALQPGPSRLGSARPRRRSRIHRRIGLIAFAGTATHYVLVYSVPSTGIPWPAGLALALAPVAAAMTLVHGTVDSRHDVHLFLAIAGVLTFLAVLDVLVGLAGRFDLTLGGIALVVALRKLRRAETPPAPAAPPAHLV